MNIKLVSVRRWVYFLPGLLIAAALLTGCANTVDLKLRLTKGQAFEQKMTSEQHIVQDMKGRQTVIDQKMGFGYSMEVQDVGAQGVMTVKGTYDWVMMDQHVSMGGAPVNGLSYDSDHPPAVLSPQAAPLSAIKGASFTFEVTPDGELRAVHGFEAIMERVLSKIGKELGPAREVLVQSFRQQFNDDNMKRMFEQATRIYPDHRVKVGDSWTKTVTVPTIFPMSLETTYLLTGLDKGVARVTINSKVMENAAGAPTDLGLTQMQVTRLAGTQTGMGEIDVATGLHRSADLKQNFSMTLDVTPSAKAPAGSNMPSMQIPVTIESSVKVEITPRQ